MRPTLICPLIGLCGDAPPSSEAVDFANTMASVAASQNSSALIRLVQAAAPVAPDGAGPLPIVPGIMPGSFENGEWTKNAVHGLVGLSNWMGGLFHSSPPPLRRTARQNRDTS